MCERIAGSIQGAQDPHQDPRICTKIQGLSCLSCTVVLDTVRAVTGCTQRFSVWPAGRPASQTASRPADRPNNQPTGGCPFVPHVSFHVAGEVRINTQAQNSAPAAASMASMASRNWFLPCFSASCGLLCIALFRCGLCGVAVALLCLVFLFGLLCIAVVCCGLGGLALL